MKSGGKHWIEINQENINLPHFSHGVRYGKFGTFSPDGRSGDYGKKNAAV
jgi:hypothetical protein